jgi:hypothetical protein
LPERPHPERLVIIYILVMNDAFKLLERLQRERFFGALEIKFENGRVTVMKKIETILPNKSRESRTFNNDNSTTNP